MNMQRAYSTFEIKAVDTGDKRTFTGTASTIGTDRMGDVVEPKGAQFKLPIPLLWQHDAKQPIGWVTSAKVTEKSIEIVGEIADVPEDGGLKARLDEAWQSLKAGLVRGLSIGFNPLESAQIEGTWGYRYLSWEWLELSAVTIPANAGASIQTIKSFDIGLPAASGTKAVPVVRSIQPGVSGKQTPKPKAPEGTMNIEEQIKQFRDTRETKSARMSDIMEASAKAGTTLDAEQTEEYDGLDAELKAIDAHLARLEGMKAHNIAAAKPVDGQNGKSAVESRQFATVKQVEKLAPGILFARHAMAVFAAKGNMMEAAAIARTHYGEESPVAKALAFTGGRSMESIIKSTVNAGTTQDATYAKPLVEYINYTGDFVEYLRGRTLVGQFGTGNVPALRRIPFNVHIKGQTAGGSASWVGEGKPKPVTAFGFNDTYHGWYKIAAIAVLTDELIRFSDPSAETLVRDSLGDVIVERMDTDFIDPAFAGSANVSPASITYGATTISSSGTDADHVRADLKALWGPSIAARNPLRQAVYITDPNTALSLSLMRNALGQQEFPGVTVNGGTLDGVPLLVSDYVPVDTAGGMVVLVNASDVYFSDDGQATVDFSNQASIQMLDNPTNASDTGTATTMVSMFQTDSTALRAHRFVNWSRRRATAVTVLTGVNWG